MEKVRIRFRDDGPMLVDGPVEIVDANGQVIPWESPKPFLALCRCGASHTKPFCDGTHRDCGFRSVVRGEEP